MWASARGCAGEGVDEEQHLPLAESREEKIRMYQEGWGQYFFLIYALCFLITTEIYDHYI